MTARCILATTQVNAIIPDWPASPALHSPVACALIFNGAYRVLRPKRLLNIQTMNYKILGICGSLRNARRGLGKKSLVDEIMAIETRDELMAYIEQEAYAHLENFKQAGRESNVPFDEMYKQLKSLKGNRGLSNSEIALAVALWEVKQKGGQIEHLSLSEYFTESYDESHLEEFKHKLIEADGFILSTPVYFGDRGSLAQSLIELFKNDDELRAAVMDKTYAGLAVGAKRNGGQETTLIYQLMDMINCGLLGMGNDSDTTSQYGGTGVAGDIGTMPKDEYGLNTAMGTGRRIANVTRMLKMGRDRRIKGRPRVMFWILQDKDEVAFNTVNRLIQTNADDLDASVFNLVDQHIFRCLACDICPTHIDLDEEYRCIIKTNRDDFSDLHEQFLDMDAIIPVTYSPANRSGLKSNYQRFIERTRYLRRGDYVFSDLVACPLVIEDLGAGEHMDVRMMTSTLRHHTIMSNPMLLYLNKGEEMNTSALNSEFRRLLDRTSRVAAARIASMAEESEGVEHKYNPVGYVLSVGKDAEDQN